jgi:hypothetical protein
LFGRYSKATNERIRDNNFPLGTAPNGFDLPSGFGAGNEFGNTRQVALGDTQVFSPTVINDARAGYSRVQIGIFNPGQAGALGFDPDLSAHLGIPGVNTCGIACTGSILLGIIGSDADRGDMEFIGDSSPFFFLSNNYYFGDALTVVRGNQSYKFGGELRVRQNQPASGGVSAKGQWQYGTTNGGFLAGNFGNIPIGPNDSGSSYANFLLGNAPAHIDRGIPGGPYLQSGKELSFFVQDDWKVNPDLTLNLGLRYDIFTPFTERFDRQLNFVPESNTLIRAGGGIPRGLRETDKNNFGPRIGFAYSGLKKDKTLVVRGGYGLLYSTDAGNTGAFAVDQPFNGGGSFSCNFNQFGTSQCPAIPAGFTMTSGLPQPPEVFLAGPVFPASSISQNVSAIDLHLKDALYHQYNLTVQWEFKPNWLAEAAFVGNLGRNLQIDRNIGQDITRGPGARLVPTLQFVNFTDDIGESSYRALQTKLEKRLSGGLSLLSAYTFASAQDNGPGRFAGNSVPARNLYGPNNPLNPDLERGSSDIEVRHRFTLANVFDLPIGRGRRFGANWSKTTDFFLGGIQWNNIITIQSGPTYTVVYGEGGPRPDLIGDPTPTADQRARRMEFNPAAFAPPSQPIFPGIVCNAAANPAFNGCFGTLGRNTFRGDRQEFWDTSFFKNFRWGERFNIQARVQIFNVANHVVRNVPERNIEACFVNGVFNAATCNTNTTDDRSGRHIGIDTSAQRQRQFEWGLRLIW